MRCAPITQIKLSINRRLLITCTLAVALLFANQSSVSAAPGVHFQVDLTTLGAQINNKWSSVDDWAYRDNWLGNDDDHPADYFSTHYPYIQSVQLMSATGGCFNGYPGCSTVNRDLFLDPKDTSTLTDYNFTPLIEAARNIVRQGLKPWIKTGAVPIKFSAHPVISRSFNVNIRPPDDYVAYAAYIKACAQALVKVFGLDEVRAWTWGVLTEFDNREWFEADNELPDSTEIAYFKLYDYTVDALESVIGVNDLRVGAHATAFTQKFWDPLTFLDHVAYGQNYATGRHGAQIDYLAFSFYEDAPGVPGDFSATTKHLGLAQTVSRLRQRATAAGLTHIQFGIDEGGILVGPDGKGLGRYAMGDSYQGSWNALLFKLMVDNDIAWFSQWDLSSNNVWDGLPYVGTHIAALSYKMAGDSRVVIVKSGGQAYPSDIIDAIAGYNSETHTLHIMVFNHNRYMLARRSETASIVIDHIAPADGSAVTVRKWQVDDAHGNFWPLWVADSRYIPNHHFGYSRYWVEPAIALLDPADISLYNSRQMDYAQAATLQSTDKSVTLAGNSLALTETLTHHSVLFYEIRNCVRTTDTH